MIVLSRPQLNLIAKYKAKTETYRMYIGPSGHPVYMFERHGAADVYTTTSMRALKERDLLWIDYTDSIEVVLGDGVSRDAYLVTFKDLDKTNAVDYDLGVQP